MVLDLSFQEEPFRKFDFLSPFFRPKKLEIGFALGEPLTFQVQNCTKSYL